MTDRDHFAAAALTGLLDNEGDGPALSKQCEYAYCIADAMLRERERVTEPTNRDTTAPATKSERVNLATANEFHAEIARLRLTDVERYALKEAADAYADNDDDQGSAEIADALRGLLDRLKP